MLKELNVSSRKKFGLSDWCMNVTTVCYMSITEQEVGRLLWTRREWQKKVISRYRKEKKNRSETCLSNIILFRW